MKVHRMRVHAAPPSRVTRGQPYSIARKRRNDPNENFSQSVGVKSSWVISGSSTKIHIWPPSPTMLVLLGVGASALSGPVGMHGVHRAAKPAMARTAAVHNVASMPTLVDDPVPSGPDAWADNLDYDAFRKEARRRARAIKLACVSTRPPPLD